VVFAPGEGENDEEDKNVAEIPLPGCRAWAANSNGKTKAITRSGFGCPPSTDLYP
jgi:hypothetical protein